MLDALGALGAAIGAADEAAAVRRRLGERLSKVDEALAALPQQQRPRVLGLESVYPLVASGQWLPDMRLRAGARDALGDVPGAPPRRLELAEVTRSGAEAIVICCCGRDAPRAAAEVAEHLLPHAEFWALPAMRAQPPRLYVVDHGTFSRPGPRL
eukprot:2216414-Prymnesium_polylepis.1